MVSHPRNDISLLSSPGEEDKPALSSITSVSAGIAGVWSWASMSQRATYTTCCRARDTVGTAEPVSRERPVWPGAPTEVSQAVLLDVKGGDKVF